MTFTLKLITHQELLIKENNIKTFMKSESVTYLCYGFIFDIQVRNN